ncbi:MAG TPA: glycosyltransferase family 4 protein [Actinomycetota bacterium]
MPRFLAFAYGCEPDKGSEPGAGWIWSRMLARIGETWVITRENNRPSIEAALPSTPERDNLRFVYVDLPERARFWKRGMRGARLYYVLWQAAAVSRARRLVRESEFDAVWHLTWANAWIGSMAALLPRPFIYGPVGGGVRMHWGFTSVVGFRGTMYEVFRALARGTARYFNPIARLAWRKARLILVLNEDTRNWLPRRHRDRAVVFPHAVLDRPPRPTADSRSPGRNVALFAGRLVPWKGGALAIQALSLLPEWRLLFCGGGPDEARLKLLAARSDVEERVDFLGWMTRDEVTSWMRKADVFLFPSLHDDAPFAVAEALAEGLPVVCLARGGAAAIAGRGVPTASVASTVAGLAEAVRESSNVEVPAFPDIDSRAQRLAELLRERFPSWGIQVPEETNHPEAIHGPTGLRGDPPAES